MIARFLPALAAGLILTSLGACSTLGQGSRETVSQVEQRRFAAMVGKDIAALDSILADELSYTHATGQVDDKKKYLESIRSGQISYSSISVENAVVHEYGDAAVVTGTVKMSAMAAGAKRELQNRYTDVYVRRDGRWQMVAWQSTSVQ